MVCKSTGASLLGFNFRIEFAKMTPIVRNGGGIYVCGGVLAYERIKRYFKYLVDYDLEQDIDGFIDEEGGSFFYDYHGKNVFRLDEVDQTRNVVIICQDYTKWTRILRSKGYIFWHSIFYGDQCLETLMRWEYLRLDRFKGIHKDERCFIIGNGPSLKIEDLDKLKNEVTFATNRIFLAFSQTDWRPNYYVCSDGFVLKDIYEQINEMIDSPVFYNYKVVLGWDDFRVNNGYFFSEDAIVNWIPNSELVTPFSSHPIILYNGKTVTYHCIQIATFMGFREIILLGVDNDFSCTVTRDGLINNKCGIDHFHQNYVNGRVPTQIDVVNSAYNSARQYCDKQGIAIKNATRGGCLEAFERVEFDSLF